jgi:hypothetical protein
VGTHTSDEKTALLQVVRTPDGFRVFDPEAVARDSDVAIESGRLVVTSGAQPGWGTFFMTALATVGLPWLLGGPWYLVALWIVLGFLGGFIVACMGIGAFCSGGKQDYVKRHRSQPEIDLADTLGLTICHIALDLAGTEAWQQKAVDPERQLAGAVWQAAGKIDHAEKLREWIESSRRAGLGDHQLSDSRSEEAGLRDSVRQTEQNLRELVGVAHQVSLASRRPGSTFAPAHSVRSSQDGENLSEQMLVHGHVVRDLIR